jgi:hypothetical protein
MSQLGPNIIKGRPSRLVAGARSDDEMMTMMPETSAVSAFDELAEA